jgi:hypothetical protein
MDKKKFEQLLDQVAEDWYIDSNPPVKGTYTSDGHQPTGPRRRTRKNGIAIDQNFNGGYPQVIKFKSIASTCPACNESIEDRIELIDLTIRRVKSYKCGCKYPFFIDSNKQKSK